MVVQGIARKPCQVIFVIASYNLEFGPFFVSKSNFFNMYSILVSTRYVRTINSHNFGSFFNQNFLS